MQTGLEESQLLNLAENNHSEVCFNLLMRCKVTALVRDVAEEIHHQLSLEEQMVKILQEFKTLEVFIRKTFAKLPGGPALIPQRSLLRSSLGFLKRFGSFPSFQAELPGCVQSHCHHLRNWRSKLIDTGESPHPQSWVSSTFNFMC